MNLLPKRSRFVTACAASAITYFVLNAAHPLQRVTRGVTADGFILPAPPLDRVVDQVNFDSEPLGIAISALSRQTGLPIRLCLPAPASAGVDSKSPVNVHMANATVGRVLDEVCASVTDATSSQLGYRISGGIIELTTLEDESAGAVTRIYDVRDLVSKTASRVDMSGHGAGWNAMNPPLTGAELRTQQQQSASLMAVEHIIKLLQDGVASDTWRDNGGTGGTVEYRWGMCANCGYDLRSSPDLCPECGVMPAALAARISAKEGGVFRRPPKRDNASPP